MSFLFTDSVAGLDKQVFIYIVKLKYLFLIFKLILVICVYITYEENIFCGLNITDEKYSPNYNNANAVIVSGITFFAISIFIEFILNLFGYTFKFRKSNSIILCLNIFAVFLLGYFIFDAWHYVTIWYIFIVAQLPQTFLEFYCFISALITQLMKYNRIKDSKLKLLKLN